MRADSANLGGSVRVGGGMDVGTTGRAVVFTQSGGTTRLGLTSSGAGLSLHDAARFEQAGGSLTVPAGQAVITRAGERVRYSVGPEGAEYVAVCLPAFDPDLAHRED